MTTEHSALSTARSATVFETNGRMAQYLSTVSGALIALAFIGQVSELGEPFFAFALTVLPDLILLGPLTYGAASTAPPGYDNAAGVLHDMGLAHSRWHLLSHSSTMVLAVTAIVARAFAAVVAAVTAGVSVHISAVAGVSRDNGDRHAAVPAPNPPLDGRQRRDRGSPALL